MSSPVRRLLPAVAVVAALASLARAEAPPAALPFTLSEIGPGVFAAIDGPKGQAGANAGFVIGDDGVVVIDSFFNPDAARALVAEIRKRTDKPIRMVINTHYHADHVGGDAVLQAAGATILAHRNVHGWVRTENLHVFGAALTPQLRATIAALPLPDLTTDSALTIWLGSRRVEVRAVPGHTGGDLIVSVPDARVVFTGDMLWRQVSPNLIDGNIADWIATDQALAAAPDAATTRFVPGHGDVANQDDVRDFVGYLSDLKALVAAKRAAGLSGDALVQAALPEFAARHGQWAAFSYFAPKELRFMDEELAGTKRRPQPLP